MPARGRLRAYGRRVRSRLPGRLERSRLYRRLPQVARHRSLSEALLAQRSRRRKKRISSWAGRSTSSPLPSRGTPSPAASSERTVSLRFGPAGFFEGVPGEIITVMPNRTWRYAGHPTYPGRSRPGAPTCPPSASRPSRWKNKGCGTPKTTIGESRMSR